MTPNPKNHNYLPLFDNVHGDRLYDVVIVGGGPAGLSAAVNASSEALDTAVIEAQTVLGGQAKYSSRIENYLGFPDGMSGEELTTRAAQQAAKFGTEFYLGAKAEHVSKDGDHFHVGLSTGETLVTKAILVTAGVQWRLLAAKGVAELVGHGVEYGATPEQASEYVGKDVYVVGGGNSAAQAAMNFSQYAAHVTMLIRGPHMSEMSEYLKDRIEETENITVICNAQVTEAMGAGQLQALRLNVDGKERSERADALFIFIGAVPKTAWVHEFCACDPRGYLLADGYQTSTPGIFAAGDVRSGSTKRFAAGVGEGSEAVATIHHYLAAHPAAVLEIA